MQELHKCSKTWRKPKRIHNFSKWSKGYRQKSCCTSHTKRHVSLFQTHSETWWWSTYCPHNCPNRISSIPNWWVYNHSAFLLHDNYKSKPTCEKISKMQIKLEHMMLSITDEISMVGYKQFQSMNQIMWTLKGTTDGSWGDICVLAVGDLYQLPPVAHCTIYMSPQTVHTLNDIASNGW